MLAPEPAERRLELAAFVRAQREQLSPAAVGLPLGRRRRTPGLRREEVAQLAGLSATWYTWIEQARDISLSPPALARLADALHLQRSARSYLFALAGKSDPVPPTPESEELPAALLTCVQRIDAPAYVLDHTWTVRGWNGAAEALFTGWLDQPGERNLLCFIFLDAAARRLICDWPARARRVTAEFRAGSGPRRGDPATLRLIEELRRRSTEFALHWDQHSVLGREGGKRSFNHPHAGRLDFEQATFDWSSQPELKLTVLLPCAA